LKDFSFLFFSCLAAGEACGDGFLAQALFKLAFILLSL
tara:strand:+ start:200 stop:313 length:114 start_codon:yes stop_codon:yes gene_type:complete